MSNFDFLRDFDNTLYKLGNRIEKEVMISPSAVKADATPFLQYILEKLLNRIGRKFNSRKDFYSQLDAVYRKGVIDYNYKNKIYSAYMLRNKIHDNFDEMEKNELAVALSIHEKLFNIAKKYYRDFNENYNDFNSVPSFKPIELDTSDDEIELVKIPDFSEIVEFKYDYCVICGEPNHSNYSLCCPKCSRILDNANNYISIRNYFGKNATFTKEDLIEYGMHEGYINQLINHLAVENMIKVAGRFYTFNNMYFDRYMTKIDNYLAVGELITKFREDKITPAEIKRTREYIEGSKRQDPFYQFFKIVNHEIIGKFERDILLTADIWKSIEYTTIEEGQLKRWYDIELSNYRRGDVNESFAVFNRLLQEEYIELKSQGVLESEIRARLNVSDEMHDFWLEDNRQFLERINTIKMELLLNALGENKTRQEAIEIAGVTAKEYDDLVKLSEFRQDEFYKKRNIEVNSRKSRFIEFIKFNDIEESCRLAKITVEDFYKWYDEDMSSDFYLDSTRILMHNFLNQRRKGKSKAEAAEAIGLDYMYVERWFNRTLDICEEFKNSHVAVVADLCYRGFKNGKSKREIAKIADISVNMLNGYLNLGQRGYGTYKKLYDYYEAEIVPRQLSRFLDEIKNKPLKKALELSEIAEEDFDHYYMLGENGDAKFTEFYYSYLNIKLGRYLSSIKKGKDESKALRNANLDKGEVEKCYELGKDGDEHFAKFYEMHYNYQLNIYISSVIRGDEKSKALENSGLMEDELGDDIDEVVLVNRMYIVTEALRKDLTTKQAARKANVSLETVYDWFLKGRKGDEPYRKFADIYYDGYVSPGSEITQKAINDDIPIKKIVKKYRKHFTIEDIEFWEENGFLDEAQERIDSEDDGEDEK